MREKDLQETPAVGEQSLLKRFCESSHPAVSLGRDLLWVACVVGGVALLLFAASGTWPAVVAVESGSVLPDMRVGDLVLLPHLIALGRLSHQPKEQKQGISHLAVREMSSSSGQMAMIRSIQSSTGRSSG